MGRGGSFRRVGFMNKAIITVLGKDTVGIIARICTYLADHNVNILDITQTIVQGYFNMMMIVDLTAATVPVAQMSGELDAIGEELGTRIQLQREEIFTMMHRI